MEFLDRQTICILQKMETIQTSMNPLSPFSAFFLSFGKKARSWDIGKRSG